MKKKNLFLKYLKESFLYILGILVGMTLAIIHLKIIGGI